MGLHDLAERLGTLKALDALTGPATKVVKQVVGAGPVKDVLSGTPLGHPAHPLLTDIPIGSFTSAALLDLFGGSKAEPAADILITVGLLAALPTAAAGAADWSDTYGSEQRIGIVHAMANLVGLGFYAASLVARRRGRRSSGTALGLAGMATMSIGGYLGGHLVYAQGIGVNHDFYQHPPGDWTPVLAEADLADGVATKADAAGASLLLYRSGSRICAIASRCTHAGGPLDEGKIDPSAMTVECPWHGSVFRLEDGQPVHGPASVPEADYEVRVNDGHIEVRGRS
jgi:nitrite reductase/ring-hydroxylating ferredoxin subunit/uncharacterized membrane protein